MGEKARECEHCKERMISFAGMIWYNVCKSLSIKSIKESALKTVGVPLVSERIKYYRI